MSICQTTKSGRYFRFSAQRCEKLGKILTMDRKSYILKIIMREAGKEDRFSAIFTPWDGNVYRKPKRKSAVKRQGRRGKGRGSSDEECDTERRSKSGRGIVCDGLPGAFREPSDRERYPGTDHQAVRRDGLYNELRGPLDGDEENRADRIGGAVD